MRLTPLLLLWKIKFSLKIQQMRGEIIEFFIIKQIKKPRLCSVLSLHFFRTLPLSASFTTQQSTVNVSLFVN